MYSKKVRAGKRRTYFFDVRRTKGDDFYLTLTESTKKFERDGFERHKIFLYKEDFNRFLAGLEDAIHFVKTELMPDYDYDEFTRRHEEYEEMDGYNSDRPRDEQYNSDRPREERYYNDRPREERFNSDRPRDERPRDPGYNSDRPREDRYYNERPPRDESYYSTRPREERNYNERPRDERPAPNPAPRPIEDDDISW